MANPPTTGLIGRWKASVGVYNTSDTSAPCTDGQAVYHWDDQSGVTPALNVIQATSANQPTYIASGINGKPIVRFDRANSTTLVSSNNATHISAGDFWAAMVYKTASSPPGAWNVIFAVDTNDLGIFIHKATTIGVMLASAGHNFADAVSDSTIYLSEVARVGGEVRLYHAELGTNPVLDANTFADTGEIRAYPVSIGGDQVGGDYGTFDIAEILLYDSNFVPATSQADLESYLSTEWGAITYPATATLSGPISGPTGSASSNFTITLDQVADKDYSFPITYAGGTVTTSPVTVTTGNQSATFTVTASTNCAKNVVVGAGSTGLEILGLPHCYTSSSSGSVSATNLVGWWESDYGLFTDAGTTAATADGALIYQWNDKSGNGFNATQSVQANRPALKLSILNGLPVIRFTGSASDILTTSAITQLGTAGLWLAVVYITGGTTPNYNVPFSIGTGGVDELALFVPRTTGKVNVDDTANNHDFVAAPATNTAYISEIGRIDVSGDQTFKLWHGYVGTSPTLDTNTFVDATDVASALACIGGSATSHYFTGDIVGIWVYSADLSNQSTDKAALETYINGKYYTGPPTSASVAGPSQGHTGSDSSDFTITLDHVADADYVFTVDCTDSNLTITTSPVTIGPNQISGTFTVNASADGGYTITVTKSGWTVSGAPLTYTAYSAATQVTLADPSIFTLVLNLNYPAPSGGQSITIGSSVAEDVISPNPVVVAENDSSGTFTLTPSTTGVRVVTITDTTPTLATIINSPLCIGGTGVGRRVMGVCS